MVAYPISATASGNTVSYDCACWGDTAQTSIPVTINSPLWFIPDPEVLLEEFKMRIQSYRKALFKRKVINNNKEHKPKIFQRMIAQSRNFRGKQANV